MIEPALSTSTPPPEEDVTTTLYRAAIGPVSNGYYLPIFTRFEAADHAGISWNSAASLLTLNWLVFRKLWVAALAYVGILVAVALLVFGFARLVFQFSDTLMMALGIGFGLAAFVLPGLFGNALFHTECRKAMAKALTGHANVADARDALLRQASTRNRLLALAAANVAVVLLAALAYQQFSALSQVTVLPHGALEAGNVAVGRTTDASSAVRVVPTPVASAAAPASEAASAMAATASSPPSPSPASAASVAASAAVAPTSSPSSAPASAASAAASLPTTASTSAATAVASVATTASAATSTPAPSIKTSEPPTAPTPTKAASASKSKTKPQESGTKPGKSASTPVVQVKAAKEPDNAKTTKKPKAAVASEPAQKAAGAASNSASAPTKSFFINVGLFGVPENAAKAHAKLLEAGMPSVMKELKAKTRQIRVRVGPYGTQAQADAAAEKIKALQLDASIVQL